MENQRQPPDQHSQEWLRRGLPDLPEHGPCGEVGGHAAGGGKGSRPSPTNAAFPSTNISATALKRAFAPRHSSTGAGTRAAPLRCRHIAAGHWRGQELELLLQKFCRKSEEISLDWGGRYEEKPLRRPRCVSLAGAAYDHITCFPELRRLREELGLDTVALDLDFLRRYRNSPRVLNYILNDLWSLRMRLRVCVPPGEPLRGLREELEPAGAVSAARR